MSFFRKKADEFTTPYTCMAAIKNGTVIDHIPANKTYQVVSLLKLEDSLIMKLVTKMGISGGQFLNEAEQALNKLPKVSGGGQVYLSNDLNKVLISAEDEAKAMGDEYVSVEHLFLCLLKQPNRAVKELFRVYGIDRDIYDRLRSRLIRAILDFRF